MKEFFLFLAIYKSSMEFRVHHKENMKKRLFLDFFRLF
jgi:hypothetical protein